MSPLTAVSGNAGTVQAVRRAAGTRLFKVDTALGIHHALGSRKNFLLVAGSFAFSIILFLAFSTAVDFMHHALTPLRPSAPDLSIRTEDSSNQIPSELAENIETYPGVKRAFGRSLTEVTRAEDGSCLLLLSYGEQQFRWAEDALLEGDFQGAVDGKGVLAVFRERNSLTAGSSVKIAVDGKEQEIFVAGVVGDVPYNYGLDRKTDLIWDMVICSEELFRKLTDENGYMALDVQLRPEAADAQVQEVRRALEKACGTDVLFSDNRISNREAKGAFYSMSVFLYGFLAVIALIGFFNIINSIAMSVSARMMEYGAMRAVGMSVRQLLRMVIGEAAAYTVFGVIFGCALGLPLNRSLFRTLVTARWGDAWSVPGWELLVILTVMTGSACLSVLGPAGRIRRMTIVDTIGRE